MNAAQPLNFAAINAAALSNIDSLLPEWLPGGKWEGSEFSCASIAGGAGNSCKTNRSGVGSDFATGEAWSDPIALYAAIHGLTQGDAAKAIAQQLHVETGHTPKQSSTKKPTAIMPIPHSVGEPPATHPQLGTPSSRWVYYDAGGYASYYVCRFDSQQGKDYRPLVYTAQGWRWQAPEEPRLIYRRNLLDVNSVLVCEGEKAADAAVKLLAGKNIAVTAWSGGANAVDKSDWSALHGKSVAIWPDNDRPGNDAAIKLHTRLQGIAAKCCIIAPPEGVTAGWDLADALAEGWTQEQLLQHLTDNKTTPSAPEGEQREAPHTTKLLCLDVAEFLTRDFPAREYLLQPILPRQGLCMLHAQRGIGKTYAALTIAYGVASGGKVFDRWAAPTPARVLLIDGEMPAPVLQERLASLVSGNNLEPPSPDYLQILTPDLQPGPMPNLSTREGQAAVEAFISGVDLIIIDNLATLARAGRSNDEESWLPMQTWLLDLRRRGKSVLLIHHQGKNGEQRGTSAKEDILDVCIRLKRPADYQADQGARFEIHLTKARGICGNEANPFEAQLYTKNNGLEWVTRDLQDVELQQLKALLNEGLSIRDCAEEMGISKGRVQRLKKRLDQEANNPPPTFDVSPGEMPCSY